MGRKPWKNIPNQQQETSVLDKAKEIIEATPDIIEPCCLICSHSKKRHLDSGVDLRTCKRNPPSFTGGDHWNERSWNQPVVTEYDFCHEFKAIE